MNDSELADLFMKRRRQVIRTSKTIYKNLLKTKMNDETKELLKESSDINEEKLIKNLNQSIGKYLNKNLDSTLDKLSALRKIHQSVKIEKIFEDKTLNTWNNLLEALAEASKLLGTKGEPIVKAIIASE
jgi:type I site-specific restriction-modification system R (restriction) subunit